MMFIIEHIILAPTQGLSCQRANGVIVHNTSRWTASSGLIVKSWHCFRDMHELEGPGGHAMHDLSSQLGFHQLPIRNAQAQQLKHQLELCVGPPPPL